MTTASRTACPVCGGIELLPGPRATAVPAHAVRLADTIDDARAEPRGDIALVFCEQCGFVFNAAFDESLLSYGTDYESTQTHSPTYRAYADQMVRDLIAKVDADGAIVDVGCGQGEFLASFEASTSRPLIGFDPAVDETRSQAPGASLVPTLFDPAAVDGDVSLITCKMTLEHVDDPVALLRDLSTLSARSGARVFVQIPNSTHMFDRVLIADLIYEHANYFTVTSLAAACARAGLEVEEISITYGDQHLGVLARAGSGADATDDVADARHQFTRFDSLVDEKVAFLRRTLQDLIGRGRTPVLWGAGSKAVALLALTGMEDAIRVAVDINPLKHGTYLPGSGIEIIAPDDRRLGDATDVFVMNPIYADEITAMLRALGHAALVHLVD